MRTGGAERRPRSIPQSAWYLQRKESEKEFVGGGGSQTASPCPDLAKTVPCRSGGTRSSADGYEPIRPELEIQGAALIVTLVDHPVELPQEFERAQRSPDLGFEKRHRDLQEK